jgi:hypothetical protein
LWQMANITIIHGLERRQRRARPDFQAANVRPAPAVP